MVGWLDKCFYLIGLGVVEPKTSKIGSKSAEPDILETPPLALPLLTEFYA